MSQSRRPSSSRTSANALSVEQLQDGKISAIYTILPVSIRRRLRRIPSLRRSVGTFTRPLSSYSSSDRSTDDTVLGTPPPEYASRLSLSEPVSDNEELGDTADGLFGPRMGESVFASAETQSGIRWKFASHGERSR
jgi:hypothetical protein